MKCKKCRHFYRMMATREGYNPFPCCHVQEDTGRRPEPLTQKCFEPRRKRQSKKICAALLALVILLLAGCGDKLREGEVCGKEFREAYTTTMIMPLTISNGKTTTTIFVPYTIHYPDRWSVTIKAYSEDNREWETATYWVTKEVFDAVNIGEQFEYDAETCLEDEPYTREKETD